MAVDRSLIGEVTPAPGAARHDGGHRRAPWRWRRFDQLETVLAACVLLVAWQLVATTVLAGKEVLASPWDTVASLVNDRSLYWRSTTATVWVVARGWFFGSVAAAVVGLIFVQVPVIERLLLRLALALFCLPLIAVAPILQIAFDGDRARVVLTALAVFFTTLVMTLLGLRSVGADTMAVIRALGGGRWAILRYARLRAASPGILAGLKLGAPAAVLGAILGEFIGSDRGLGVVLINGLATLRPDRVWGVALITTALATIGYATLELVSRVANPWAAPVTSTSAPAPAGSPSGGWRGALGAVAWGAASIGVIVVAWIGFLRVFDLSAFSAKSPADVVDHLFFDPAASERRAELWSAAAVTLRHAATGFALGMVVAVAVAVLFVRRPGLERAVMPLAIALRSVPIVVVTPMIILALGRGTLAVATITGIISFFPALANTIFGLRSTPDESLALMHVYDAGAWRTLWKVQLPSAVPAVFASIRIAAPVAVLGATLAEWLATGDGLGNTIVAAQSASDFTALWTGAAVLTAISFVVYSLVATLERVMLTRFAPDRVSG